LFPEGVLIINTPRPPRFSRDGGPPIRKTRMNHEIRLTPVRLINENNEQVGVVETRDALRMAQEAGLDLVEIQADVRPPICKIMDYGKYKFELSKKERGNRAASKAQELKEVRLGRSAKIDPHDVMIRVTQARGFLMEGHKVQFVQRFRGREMAHKEIGEHRLQDIVKELADISKVEVAPRLFGKQITLILAPDKVKIQAIKRKLDKERGITRPQADNDHSDSHEDESDAQPPSAPEATTPAAAPAQPQATTPQVNSAGITGPKIVHSA